MLNALFLVWRESFEAVLVVGILFAYLRRQPDPKRALNYMWAGVAAGAALSGLLAVALQAAETELQGLAIEYFRIGMLVVAAVLMTQMCIWMKSHSRKIKSELESGLREALDGTRLFGVASLAALAVAREGCELVMFFFGMGVEASAKGALGELMLYSLGGILLTAVTWWAFSRGLKVFNPKVFFQVTAVFLLVTASALLLQATRMLTQMDVIPTLHDQVWDTSALLDERSGIGQVVSSMTGYESSPSLVIVLVYAAFWAVVVWFWFKGGPAPVRTTPKAVPSV